MVEISPSEITPEHIFLNRRKFMIGAGSAATLVALAACGTSEEPPAPAAPAAPPYRWMSFRLRWLIPKHSPAPPLMKSAIRSIRMRRLPTITTITNFAPTSKRLPSFHPTSSHAPGKWR